mmetsp:Transcript_55190/g.112914  ORF Transcript_55190/g.112914 Transcript_55190/m.112914 type:complete len:201 (-) Transcript_55190:121-723(-)
MRLTHTGCLILLSSLVETVVRLENKVPSDPRVRWDRSVSLETLDLVATQDRRASRGRWAGKEPKAPQARLEFQVSPARWGLLVRQASRVSLAAPDRAAHPANRASPASTARTDPMVPLDSQAEWGLLVFPELRVLKARRENAETLDPPAPQERRVLRASRDRRATQERMARVVSTPNRSSPFRGQPSLQPLQQCRAQVGG